MSSELSRQAEQYLAGVVAEGLYASKQDALEAAVQALRAITESVPMVPAEHMALVEQGMESARAGRGRELTDADWQRIRQAAR
jgi:Arc/MetJ-type ribon-helix-helix transcriptional regulator